MRKIYDIDFNSCPEKQRIESVPYAPSATCSAIDVDLQHHLNLFTPRLSSAASSGFAGRTSISDSGGIPCPASTPDPHAQQTTERKLHQC